MIQDRNGAGPARGQRAEQDRLDASTMDQIGSLTTQPSRQPPSDGQVGETIQSRAIESQRMDVEARRLDDFAIVSHFAQDAEPVARRLQLRGEFDPVSTEPPVFGNNKRDMKAWLPRRLIASLAVQTLPDRRALLAPIAAQ